MWGSFFFSCFVGTMMLYLPGAAALKALRFRNSVSFLAAPIPSCLFYALAAVVCGKLGVPVDGVSLFGGAMVVATFSLAISMIVWKTRNKLSMRHYFMSLPETDSCTTNPLWADRNFNFKVVILYAVIGLAVGFYVFVKPLDGPESFALCYDDLTHMGIVQSFIETGNYSSLTTTLYPGFDGVSGSYYPALWHQLTAMVASFSGVSSLLAANAVNYIVTSLVYPLGFLFFFMQVFKQYKRAMVAGGLVCLMFVAFPWYFLIYGRLLANMMGFVFVPMILGCAVAFLASKQKASERVRMVGLAFCGCLLAVFTQPNMFFSVIALFVPYGVYRIWSMIGGAWLKHQRLLQFAGVFVFLAVVGVFWHFCLHASFMQGVVSFVWPPVSTIVQALVDSFLLSSSFMPVQIVLSLFLFVGIYAALKDRSYSWLIVTYLLTVVMYVACAATEGRWDQVLTGFWYGDRFRISALLAIAATPLVAFGLAKSYSWIEQKWNPSRMTWGVLVLVLMVAMLFPSFTVRGLGDIETPMGKFRYTLHDMYRVDQTDTDIIFSDKERKFTDRVKESIGDAPVYNAPYDGSMFAYQYNGLKTFHRHLSPGSTEAEKILDLRLSDYGTDEEVQKAARELGVEYVIMLDYGHEPFWKAWPEYHPEYWEGFEGIDMNTPGFELMLSEGDRKLFRLIPIEELAESDD